MAAIGRLTTVLAADVVGYQSMVAGDDRGVLERLEAHRRQVVYPKIAEHHGRIAKATRESLLVEFPSPIEAMKCAVEVQRDMIDRNASMAPAERITLRVGIHIGRPAASGDDLVIRAVAALPVDRLSTLIRPATEVHADDGDIAGRLAALAGPAGICVSGAVRDAIGDGLPYTFEEIEEQKLDGGTTSVHCYAMSPDCVVSRRQVALKTRGTAASWHMWWRSVATSAAVFAVVAIWSAALWAWLGPNSSTAPATGRSHTAASRAAVPDERSPLVWQPVVQSNSPADRDIQAPPALQPAAANGPEADRNLQPPPVRPTVSEIGAAVIKGKDAWTAMQATPDSGPAVIRGIQVPPAARTALDSGAIVVRGK